MVITVTGDSGYTNGVMITLNGLPKGATTAPALPLTMTPGTSERLSVTLPRTAPPGSSTITVEGRVLHRLVPTDSAPLALKVIPHVRTYREGRLLVLERVEGRDSVRIGLDTAWGGSLVEASLNGVNMVNSFDPGREVQLAVYDRQQMNPLGWNPVQGGDSYGHGSPILEQRLEQGSLYTKTRPLHWYPERVNGGSPDATPSDVYFEQWVEPVPGYPTAFHFHYRITHFGLDTHATARQEVPAVYVNHDFNEFVTYSGTAPWTDASASATRLAPSPGEGQFYPTPERWAAFINQDSVGLALFVPDAYGYFEAASHPNGTTGPQGRATNYLRPLAVFGLGPQSTFEGDYYLILGDYRTARQVIYALHRTIPTKDVFAPYLTVDAPIAGDTLSGTVAVRGWGVGTAALAHVSISVDSGPPTVAQYGTARPDVARVLRDVPANIGFSDQLDTRHLANGQHVLHVQATDVMGNVAIGTIAVHVRN